jgi:hypothetical protein
MLDSLAPGSGRRRGNALRTLGRQPSRRLLRARRRHAGECDPRVLEGALRIAKCRSLMHPGRFPQTSGSDAPIARVTRAPATSRGPSFAPARAMVSRRPSDDSDGGVSRRNRDGVRDAGRRQDRRSSDQSPACASCRSVNVLRSRVRWYERVCTFMADIRPYRCRTCNRRFWALSSSHRLRSSAVGT